MKSKCTIISVVVFLLMFYLSGIYSYENLIYSKKDRLEKEPALILVTDYYNYYYNEDGPFAIASQYYEADEYPDIKTLYLLPQEAMIYQTVLRTDLIADDYSYEYLEDELFNVDYTEEDEDISITLASINIDTNEIYLDDQQYEIQEDAVIEELIQEPVIEARYSDIGISIAKSFVNIREKASTDSTVMGKLYRDSAAKILDQVGDWYYVESGKVKGYVNAAYIKTNIPDDELISKYGTLSISVNASGLNVRQAPDSDSKKLTVVYSKETYPAIEILDEWVKIEIKDKKISGYVVKEHVELHVEFNKAVSREEEQEILRKQAEEKQAILKKQAEEKAKKETAVVVRDGISYSLEDLKLLATLTHAEAGNQSYEGKLAVANVVLNRVKSKRFPNTIRDVIYQKGQFSVATNGALDKQLAKYDNYTTASQKASIRAAKAALEGSNNIGNRMFFHSYRLAVQRGHDQRPNSVRLQDHLFW